MKKYGIIKFLDGDFDLDVNVLPLQNTIWETQNHIANFLKNLVIQLLNILIIFFFKRELSEKTFGRNSDITNHNPTKLYNLEVIILLVIGTNQKDEF